MNNQPAAKSAEPSTEIPASEQEPETETVSPNPSLVIIESDDVGGCTGDSCTFVIGED